MKFLSDTKKQKILLFWYPKSNDAQACARYSQIITFIYKWAVDLCFLTESETEDFTLEIFVIG
jgi:hypothetical protein